MQEDFMPIFAKRLRETRRSIPELTQDKLAEAIEVTAQTISGIETYGEKSHKKPSIDTAVSIARALDVPLDYLCGLIDNPKLQKIKNYGDAVECIDEMIDSLCCAVDADSTELTIVIRDDRLSKYYKTRLNMLRLTDKDEIEFETYCEWHESALSTIKDVEILKQDTLNGERRTGGKSNGEH